MTDVVIAEDDGIGSMESNEEESLRSLWKFCNSITLPRSEVVFFTQATLICPNHILYCYIIVVFDINSFFTIKKIFNYETNHILPFIFHHQLQRKRF